MTNPTRTRADIQAEIEKLQQEMESAWPKEGDKVYIRGTATHSEPDKSGDVRVVLSPGYVYYANSTNLVPAADLIPREEHEAALAEAKEVTLADAITKLVTWRIDNPSDQFDVVADPSGLYRVTVERVDTKPEPAAVEPVGWCVDFGDGGLSGSRHNTKASAELHSSTFPVIPLYRHPAPAKLDANTAIEYLVNEYDLDTGHVDTAKPRIYPFDHNGHVYEVVVRRKGQAVEEAVVAPESLQIVKWLRDYEECLRYENKQCLADQIRKCWQGIRELPEPSEEAKKLLHNGWLYGQPTQLKREVAAALLAKEADHD